MTDNYTVVVGNVGTVYSGLSKSEAHEFYEDYTRMSKRGEGRAAHEDVTLLVNGEPKREHNGSKADGAREYDVCVERASYRSTVIRVTASSSVEAEDRALEAAGDVDFSQMAENSCDYYTKTCEPVTKHQDEHIPTE